MSRDPSTHIQQLGQNADPDEVQSVSRLRSFWKRSSKAAGSNGHIDKDGGVSERDLGYELTPQVTANPTTNKFSNLFHRQRHNNASSRNVSSSSQSQSQQSEPSSDNKTPAQKRRQQVYQAQKRHRNKKASYTAELEAEVARLQQLESAANAEKEGFEWQNVLIKRFLASEEAGLELRLAVAELGGPANAGIGGGSYGEGGSEETMVWRPESAAVDVRWDGEVGHARTFVGGAGVGGAMYGSCDELQTRRETRIGGMEGDSAAALDFILALEWPCQDHTFHEHLHPPPEGADVAICGGFEETGHALTATATVYASALRSELSSNGVGGNIGNASTAASKPAGSGDGGWQLPHAEIEKLVALSTQLPIEVDRITPAQAYSAVKDAVPADAYLRPALEALKEPLGSLMFCYGFGAALGTESFWRCFDGVIQALEFTSPELVGSK